MKKIGRAVLAAKQAAQFQPRLWLQLHTTYFHAFPRLFHGMIGWFASFLSMAMAQELLMEGGLKPLQLTGVTFDQVVKADSAERVIFFCASAVEPDGGASGAGVAASIGRTIKVGGFGGGRPSLAELRKLNEPGLGIGQTEAVGPDEQLGGEKKAFGSDKASGKGLRSGASCLEVLQKRSVLVAVRARPLNDREKAEKSSECLTFQDVTGLTLHRDDDREHKFAFDCVMSQEIGQREVYDRTARPLLHKVLEGYNGCLFAYGQTGSGKTFTMQGAGDQPGIIPTLCKELFNEIQELRSSLR
eukprot:s1907_g17.t1